MVQIFPTARLRASPYYEATIAEGMTTCSVYNGMIMPAFYGDPEAEYWRLIEGVSQWDVAVERQVQLKGKDAMVLAQAMCARDLSNCAVGQGKYVPMVDYQGTLMNDPILLKLADDLVWLSISDSDMWLWAKAIAAERGLDVVVTEPDVSPMAIQGPKAEAVVASVVGDWVKELKYFWFRETEIEGIPVAVQRSGWSKQGGFEIYLRDGKRGVELWNIFKEAGQPYDIGPGAPTSAERTESGLVSCDGDTDDHTSPFEVRMDKFTDTHLGDDVVGMEALKRIKEEGAPRHQLGLILDGNRPSSLGFKWEEIDFEGETIGHMTNCVWSPRMKTNIGYALISREVGVGNRVLIRRPAGAVEAELVPLPFL